MKHASEQYLCMYINTDNELAWWCSKDSSQLDGNSLRQGKLWVVVVGELGKGFDAANLSLALQMKPDRSFF